MSRKIPVSWDDISDSTLLPVDIYVMTVKDITEMRSRDDNLLMYKAEFSVQEPTAYAGLPFTDYYVIGNKEDPDAQGAETWKNSIGLKRLKRLATSTLVPLGSDIDKMIESMKGQSLSVSMGQKVEMKDGPYKGTKRNQIERMYALGAAPVWPKGAPADGNTPGPRPAARMATAPTLPCPFCPSGAAPVLRTEYSQHVKDVHPGEA